jgi:RimJ/RimL family protein N-acetyltransferase
MIHGVEQVAVEVLEAGRAHVLAAPSDLGTVALVVRRPSAGEREVVSEGVLDARAGLVGDNWRARGSRHTADGSAIPEMQVTVMNVRVADLVAGGRDNAPMAGDQLYVDFDLGQDSLPTGTLLVVGSAVLEVSAAPHLGCKKFVDRFGGDAMRFVNSAAGRQHRFRGVNTRVVTPGRVRVGDVVRKLTADELDGTRLRGMRHDDLATFVGWLDQPHVRQWWPSPVGEQAHAEYAASIDGADPTDVFVIEHGCRPVGMIQRYRVDDYPEWAKALPDEVDVGVAAGIDYLVGVPELTGRGIGTAAIRQATSMTFDWWPDVTTVAVAVQQANPHSWRALERAGYARVWDGLLDSDDPSDAGPAYLYLCARPA